MKNDISIPAAALAYANKGWWLFPAPPGQKKSHVSKKYDPNERNWGMTNDPEQIKQYWQDFPAANLGLPTGKENGFFVCEADTIEGHGVDGIGNLRALEHKHGKLPATLMAESPSGSLHCYFNLPPDIEITCSNGLITEGIDIKGEGGMVIAPPSVRHDGIYHWLTDLDHPIADAPAWLLQLITAAGQRRKNRTSEGKPHKITDQWEAGLFAAAVALKNNYQRWEEWNRFIMAIYFATGGSDEGRKLAHVFSAKWSGYDEDATDDRWEALHGCPPTDIGSGTVYRQANIDDPSWRQRYEAAHPKPPPTSQWFGEKPATPPPALIKGVLPQTGVAIIGGQTGGGKTFHAIHLATCLIPDCKQEFYIDKYRIKRHGGVLYLVLEGKPAFHMRVNTAFNAVLGKQMNLGDNAKLPFSWNTYEPNLFEKGPDKLIKLVERDAAKMRQDFNVDMVAVMLDTMGLAACYENEDRAAQVQKVISGLRHLSDVTGALAIGVDHFGKDQQAGLRGSSAKRGHVETVLACLVDRDENENAVNHRLKFEKIRDGEEGRIIPYRLKVEDLGIDEDGDRVTTCVVQWEPERPPPPQRRRAPQKRHKTDIALERATKDVPLPADPGKLRAAFYKHHGGTKHAANVAWRRAVETARLVLINGELDRDDPSPPF